MAELKDAGNRHMTNGSYAKAIRAYSKAIELDPANAVLYSNRSAAFYNMKKFEESLEDAESAILIDDQWWKAYKRKGISLIQMQKFEEAVKALEEGMAIVKKNAEMEKNLEFARTCFEQAQNLYILPGPELMEKLEHVPVFIVTDEAGQPFFVTYEDGQQVCTFYFDQVDAQNTLTWIQEENSELGKTARVIHITLNQAFNLAQQTQKQYYEDTIAAAAAIDRAAAEAEAAAAGTGDTKNAGSSSEDLEDVPEAKSEASSPPVPIEPSEETEPSKDDASKPSAAADADSAEKTEEEKAMEGEGSIPLAFQFRAELRQVEGAVELVRKNPASATTKKIKISKEVLEQRRKAMAKAQAAEDARIAAEAAKDKENNTGASNDENVESKSDDDAQGEVPEKEGESKPEAKSPSSEEKSSLADESVVQAEGTEEKSEEAEAEEKKEGEDYNDDELCVDNFNGIPIFQAKGLTVMQDNVNLIPLFLSKWDLEEAWNQLSLTKPNEVPKEVEIDVGTLEDVLRRMAECKTGDFDNVVFIPSRESVKAIGARFPLDEAMNVVVPMEKKVALAVAKEIKARGGTEEEIRAAVKKEVEAHLARQKIIEQAERQRRAQAEQMRLRQIYAQIAAARRNGTLPTPAVKSKTVVKEGESKIDRKKRRQVKREELKKQANLMMKQRTQRNVWDGDDVVA